MATKPPRTRSGQTYPGGRQMRKALRRLSRRQINAVPISTGAYTCPGSMSR